MTYNSRNNDAIESQKEKKAVLLLSFGRASQKSRIIKVYILGINVIIKKLSYLKL